MQIGDAISNAGVKTTTNADGTSSTQTTTPKLPSPSRFFAAMIVYLMLAGLAAFGPAMAKLAGRLGGLVALVIVLAPPDSSQPISSTNQPLVMRFLALLVSYTVGGPISTPGGTTNRLPNTTGQGAGGALNNALGNISKVLHGTASVVQTGPYNQTGGIVNPQGTQNTPYGTGGTPVGTGGVA